MSKYGATKNNNNSPMPSTKKQVQAIVFALEVKINYTEPYVEEIAPIMAVSGVIEPGKQPVPKPNIHFLDEKAYTLKAGALSIQVILKRKR